MVCQNGKSPSVSRLTPRASGMPMDRPSSMIKARSPRRRPLDFPTVGSCLMPSIPTRVRPGLVPHRAETLDMWVMRDQGWGRGATER